LLLIVPLASNSQVDFNEYKTIQAVGALPSDYSSETYQKVLEQMKERQSGMSQIQQKEFLESTHYAIDDLLHSGYVVFGDELSNYISSIADSLLRDDPKTRSELRFYTLKTTAANAFSTDQGIIFVTTGLISQVSNEAQLAFILAHEICHYREKHVLESFTWNQRNKSRRDWVNRMSIYSRDREFDADRLAVDLYNNAGYTEDALKSTFDVLKYSYLPFDEIEVPKSYFITQDMFLPDILFPSTAYDIKAEEDQDDTESSHPNIKRRREAIDDELAKYSTWGTSNFLLGKDQFYNVRNISRFECVRTSIIDSHYGDALYSIYLLEKDFPSSIYLQRMKAQAWLGIYQYEREHHISKTIKKVSDYEGASATVHYLIRKLNLKAMGPVALRNIYDIFSAHPEDSEITAIYERLIAQLAQEKKFQIGDYSKLNFSTAAQKFLDAQLVDSTDTVKVEVVEEIKTSKYDRINTKGTPDSPNSFDTTKFYIYAISDVIRDEDFIKRFDTEKDKLKAKDQAEKDFQRLSSSEQASIRKEAFYSDLHLGVEDVICVEPKVYSYTSRGVDYVKSEQLEQRFSEAFDDAANEAGVTLYSIDSRSIQANGVQVFNERSTLTTLLNQVSSEEDINLFPVDYQALSLLSENYGSENIMFSLVEHSFDVDIRWAGLLISILAPPVFAVVATVHIPTAFMKANSTALSVIIIDAKTGTVKIGSTYYFNEPIRKMHLGAHLYDILNNLKTPQ
jgi:hypothetical protein